MAVKRMARAMGEMRIDAFKMSSILAYIYEKPKEKVLDDLLDERSGGELSRRRKMMGK